MNMRFGIEEFPMSLLDTMKSDLERFVKCEIQQLGTDVQVSCSGDVVQCMQVVAIVDKYNILAKNNSSNR